jgi:transcription termination factor NusB
MQPKHNQVGKKFQKLHKNRNYPALIKTKYQIIIIKIFHLERKKKTPDQLIITDAVVIASSIKR